MACFVRIRRTSYRSLCLNYISHFQYNLAQKILEQLWNEHEEMAPLLQREDRVALTLASQRGHHSYITRIRGTSWEYFTNGRNSNNNRSMQHFVTSLYIENCIQQLTKANERKQNNMIVSVTDDTDVTGCTHCCLTATLKYHTFIHSVHEYTSSHKIKITSYIL